MIENPPHAVVLFSFLFFTWRFGNYAFGSCYVWAFYTALVLYYPRTGEYYHHSHIYVIILT
jgi:hypothetical protein